MNTAPPPIQTPAGTVAGASDQVKLSAEESRRFLAALDKPFAPNARLKKAMERDLARR